MSVYDGADLVALTLDNNEFSENSAEDTPIGDFIGVSVGSTLSLTDDAGDRVKLSGNSLLVGPTPSAAGTHNFTVRETNEGVTRDTNLFVSVSA
jgi:hypothetical protein